MAITVTVWMLLKKQVLVYSMTDLVLLLSDWTTIWTR